MRILKSPVFIICCILFVIHQLVDLFYDEEIPLIDSYLDVFLAMPIILTFLLLERKHLFRWKNYHRLNFLEVTLATVFVAFISEIVFPAFSDEFTRDWVDLLIYFAGALLFYFTINPKSGHSESTSS